MALENNNAKAARDVYVNGLLGGKWKPDDSRWILHMQDDPTELLGLIKETNARPDVAKALAKMLAKQAPPSPPERDRPWLKPGG